MATIRKAHICPTIKTTARIIRSNLGYGDKKGRERSLAKDDENTCLPL